MATTNMGLGLRPRLNDNLVQNQVFQGATQGGALSNGPGGVLDPTRLGQLEGAQGSTEALFKKLEELLKQFMHGLQSREQGGEAAGAPKESGGAESAGQAGDAQDPLFTLEELLRQMRALAQRNPEALQQFLNQNPQLAQMLGAQLGGLEVGMGGGLPSIDAGSPLI